MARSVTVAEYPQAYRDAAQIVRERGLAQEIFEMTGGEVCMIGGLAKALGDDGFSSVCYDHSLLTPLAETLGWTEAALNRGVSVFGWIALWNDEDGRTAEEVAAKLEEAADRLTRELEGVTV